MMQHKLHLWPIIFDTSIWFPGFDRSFPSEGAAVLSRYLHGYKKHDSGIQVMLYRHHLDSATCMYRYMHVAVFFVSPMSITTTGMPCDVLLWVTLILLPNVGSVGTSVYLLQSLCRSVSGNDSGLRVAPGVSIGGCVNDKLKVLVYSDDSASCMEKQLAYIAQVWFSSIHSSNVWRFHGPSALYFFP